MSTTEDPSASHGLIGQTIAQRYRVERVIGQGGMGVVLQAVHVDLGEKVAVKVLLPYAAKNREYAERFIQEAKTAASIKSEHVARVFDFGKGEDGSAYLIMELLDGCTLGERIETSGPIPFQEAATIVYQACLGLMEAHARRLVHRDIKPDNLFLVQTRVGHTHVKVLDFGISKRLDGPGQFKLTQTGMVFGSPLYMSPEQLRASKDIDARTDVWSLGAVLFESVAGVPPFEGDNMTSLALQISQDPIPDLRLSGVPDELTRLIEQCLSKNPAQRPVDAQALATLLEPWTIPKQLGNSLRPPPQMLSAPVVRISHSGYPSDDKTAEDPLSTASTLPSTRVLDVRKRVGRSKVGFALASMLALATGSGLIARGLATSDSPRSPATPQEPSMPAHTSSTIVTMQSARFVQTPQVEPTPASRTMTVRKPGQTPTVPPTARPSASAAPRASQSDPVVPSSSPTKVVSSCPPGTPPGVICVRD